MHAHPVDHQVGRGIVAQDNHQHAQVAQRDLKPIVQVGQRAAGGHFVRLPDGILLLKAQQAVPRLPEGLGQNGQLNDAGGDDRRFRAPRDGFTR